MNEFNSCVYTKNDGLIEESFLVLKQGLCFERLGIQAGLEKGKLEGVRSTLFLLLSARGLSVSASDRARIEAQHDIKLLTR